MPHTTRRSRQHPTAAAAAAAAATAQAKRAHIALDDGWTLVSTTKSLDYSHSNARGRARGEKNGTTMPGGGGGGGGRGGGLSAANLRAAHTPAGPAHIMPGTSKEKLLDRLAAFRERWTECACRQGIRTTLSRAGTGGRAGTAKEAGEAAGGGEQQGEEAGGKEEAGAGAEGEAENGTGGKRNAVCIGLGSLSVDNVAAGVRSMWQLVCFLDMVDMLSAAGGESQDQRTKFALYVEDPVFNALDEEIFQELGIEVVQGRRATDGSRQEGAAQFIEHDSFVFAPFMPSFMVLEDFLADKDPAIYVGNDVQATLELAKSQVRYSGDVDERTRRCIRVAEEFLAQGRETVTMPEFDLHEHALAGQMIYWRKPEDDE